MNIIGHNYIGHILQVIALLNVVLNPASTILSSLLGKGYPVDLEGRLIPTSPDDEVHPHCLPWDLPLPARLHHNYRGHNYMRHAYIGPPALVACGALPPVGPALRARLRRARSSCAG